MSTAPTSTVAKSKRPNQATSVLAVLHGSVSTCASSARHAPKSALRRRHTAALDDLFCAYKRHKEPIDVNFRELVGPIPVNDLTHSMYPYPARLLRQIPRFFLRCEQLVGRNTVVLDPFCGSGTVLVEAHAAGLPSWGIDSKSVRPASLKSQDDALGRR